MHSVNMEIVVNSVVITQHCSVCTGFVMLLQFRYQRAKLYRQVAMGKKHHLSVSQGTSTLTLYCEFSLNRFLVITGYE